MNRKVIHIMGFMFTMIDISNNVCTKYIAFLGVNRIVVKFENDHWIVSCFKIGMVPTVIPTIEQVVDIDSTALLVGAVICINTYVSAINNLLIETMTSSQNC